MDHNLSRQYLTKRDLEEYPIWKFSDIDDLSYPVCGPEDFPDDPGDLRIRANFITSKGRSFSGLIVGVSNVFSVSIFSQEKKFQLNKNMLEHSIKSINKLAESLGEELTLEDFSPLSYTTTIDLENFKNISGEFDLLKERTDEERLGFGAS